MDKKEQIIETATDLFAANGFDGTSIRDISGTAGVNIAMVNYYFGSKEKLFTNIIETKISITHERLLEIASDSSLDEMKKMEAVVELYVNKIISFPAFHRILQQELIFGVRYETQDMITSTFRKNAEIVKSIIDEGVAKGLFKPVDGYLTLVSIIGTVNQVMCSKKLCLSLLNRGGDSDPVRIRISRNES